MCVCVLGGWGVQEIIWQQYRGSVFELSPATSAGQCKIRTTTVYCTRRMIYQVEERFYYMRCWITLLQCSAVRRYSYWCLSLEVPWLPPVIRVNVQQMDTNTKRNHETQTSSPRCCRQRVNVATRSSAKIRFIFVVLFFSLLSIQSSIYRLIS